MTVGVVRHAGLSYSMRMPAFSINAVQPSIICFISAVHSCGVLPIGS